MKTKTGILLVNLGTPDSPKVHDVRKYLTEFLNDPRVIDVSWLWRSILVKLFIVPFRAPKSAKVYKQLWTDKGSPIIYHTESLKNKLQEVLKDDGFVIEYAMRYQNPSIKKGLEKLREHQNLNKIVIIPLFPQYASATNGSINEMVMKIVSKWWVIPEIQFINEFHDNPLFIDAFVEKGKEYDISSFDHVLFSYHGLPERQVDKVHPGKSSNNCDCIREFREEYRYCYKAACYSTTKLITEKLGIEEGSHTVTFQSRLNDKWLKPFTDEKLVELAKEGKKSVLVFSPAFVSDCLETTIEIGDEYQELFTENGGEKVQLVESLNDHPKWVECLKEMVLRLGVRG